MEGVGAAIPAMGGSPSVSGGTLTLPGGKFVYSNILMHIEHPSKQQDDLYQFLQMRQDETYTDMIFVTQGGKRLKVHSLVLAAVSDLIKRWMEETRSQGNLLGYYVYLPGMVTNIALSFFTV